MLGFPLSPCATSLELEVSPEEKWDFCVLYCSEFEIEMPRDNTRLDSQDVSIVFFFFLKFFYLYRSITGLAT